MPSETKTIEILVCKSSLGAYSVSKPPAIAEKSYSVDPDGGTITIFVQRTGTNPTSFGIIEVPVSQDDDHYACLDYTDLITWGRQVVYKDEESGVEVFAPEPTLTVKHPECCHWRKSLVHMFGPDKPIFQGELFKEVKPTDDGFTCEANSTAWQITQLTWAPGMMLQLSYEFFDGRNTVREAADLVWLGTCCFTGGWVEEVHGSYEDINITYTVNIMGQSKTCRPSDWITHSVGDWVFVTRISSECAGNDIRQTNCQAASVPSNDVYVILPLKVSDYDGGGMHQELEFDLSEVKELLDASVKQATIIVVNREEGTADIEIEGQGVDGRVNDVELFYHCFGETTIEDCQEAFVEEDSVLVLYNHEAPRIFGFTDRLVKCMLWENWKGPNVASNHPWDLDIVDYGQGGVEAFPADAPSYIDEFGSYCKVENGTLKISVHGAPFSQDDGYNNLYLYLRAKSDYPIEAPAGIMIINVEHAESPGDNNSSSFWLFDSEGTSLAVVFTIDGISSTPDSDYGNADITHYLGGSSQQTLSGIFTVDLVALGLILPIESSFIEAGSGTEDCILEINGIDFL